MSQEAFSSSRSSVQTGITRNLTQWKHLSWCNLAARWRTPLTYHTTLQCSEHELNNHPPGRVAILANTNYGSSNLILSNIFHFSYAPKKSPSIFIHINILQLSSLKLLPVGFIEFGTNQPMQILNEIIFTHQGGRQSQAAVRLDSGGHCSWDYQHAKNDHKIFVRYPTLATSILTLCCSLMRRCLEYTKLRKVRAGITWTSSTTSRPHSNCCSWSKMNLTPPLTTICESSYATGNQTELTKNLVKPINLIHWHILVESE